MAKKTSHQPSPPAEGHAPRTKSTLELNTLPLMEFIVQFVPQPAQAQKPEIAVFCEILGICFLEA